MSMVTKVVRRIGPLRFMLQFLAFIFIFLSQSVGTRMVYAGWEFMSTVIVPALIPLIFFGMLLELMMSTVFMLDAEEPDKKARYRTIVKIDVMLIVGLLLFWVPTLMRMLRT